MEKDVKPINPFNFKRVSPFKWFVIENFPFIEEDFDAITEYQLYCKLVEYLNKVIASNNLLGTQVENITNAVIELENYVNNYFNNLDVQEEINNKLNQMAEDGTLADIINQEIFGEIQANIKKLESQNTIFIGDSYGAVDNSWIDQVAKKMGLTLNQTYWKFARNGYGFARTNMQWLDLLKELETSITDKTSIKNMIICGGLNDTNAQTQSQVLTAITLFTNYVNANYPNCTIYIGCIGWHEAAGNPNLRNQVLTKVLPAYQSCAQNGNAVYLSGVEYIMHYYGFYGVDASHPNDVGQIYLANGIYQSFKTGFFNFNTSMVTTTSDTGVAIEQQIVSNQLLLRLYGSVKTGVIDTTTTGNKKIDLGEIHPSYVRKVNNSSNFHVTLLINYGSLNFRVQPAKVTINTSNNHVEIEFYNTVTTAYEAIGILDSWTYYNLLVF